MTALSDDTLQVRAPAKINLTLSVTGRRPDGFHDLESWVAFVDCHDELRIERSTSFRLEVDNDEAVPTDDRNLVHRAAHALAQEAGVNAGAVIRLHKRIPAGAGLGGGSSDAAACLIGLSHLWGLGLGRDKLAAIGAGIGSDVPLFFHGGQLVMRGRGELIEPLDRAMEGFVALICPPLHVSTAEVYAAHARSGTSPAAPRPWERGPMSCERIAPQLFNDLEQAAFEVEPALRRLHDRLDGLEGRPVRVTGSGAAMFALFDDEVGARAWADAATPVAGGALVRVHRIMTNTKAIQI
ncbi:MAG TPA: 4-(cytidine 5'-diphospho)-2-C-methyl-D-erythritol kinase [Phycisphaerae bacterium]|nr:4-(cytidine 5'-diphospho)-2-C-methyl-D-erythritol kinase [Phycisphaerae bacterium]HRW52750.1 4-(cytidine 5'-diphospho)-2-C-methyl-D-erythritol kinase [Phycisphaerae bacterium]